MENADVNQYWELKMNFEEARNQIKKGKKVRRKSWIYKDFFLPVSDDYGEHQPYLEFEDLDAKDWEIYKKKVYCKSCGREL